MATKPTKQQAAQAKARAGGNNPIKVTNKGLKKLGSAALIAASLTPVGRGVKAASIAAKPIAAAARNAAGKKVVSATMGKAAAEKYATAAAKRTAQRTQTASDLKNTKTFATPKSGVTVKPGRTATGPGLETRGIKPTRTQRSERAAELSFKKAEGRYEGEYLTRMTGLRGPKGVTSQSTRGQGARSLRKEAAINKEAKTKIVRINSAPKKK